MHYLFFSALFFMSIFIVLGSFTLFVFKRGLFNKKRPKLFLFLSIWFTPYFIFIFFFTGPKDLNEYPSPTLSPYKLPWKAGVSRFVPQGNNSFTTHRNLHYYAWDFMMANGSPVLAAIGGVVDEVVQSFDGIGFNSNYIHIRHDDGTYGGYAHIRKNSSHVKVGEEISQGQLIALSGMVGETIMPHLHFYVLNQDKTASLPISFQGVRGGVPLAGRFYTSNNTLNESNKVGAFNGAFVLFDTKDKTYEVINKKLAETRLSPCSSFKVPHTVFGLEHGYITGKDFSQKYDPVKIPKKSWWPEQWPKDHTLQSAVQNSVVWFYQGVARHIGEKHMTAFLKRLDYGNADISGGIDRFWLSSSLKISPLEQVQAWERLFSYETDFNREHINLVKDIIVLEETPIYTLRGKTGTCSYPNGQYGAWLVGILENKQKTYFFATYLKSDNFKKVFSERLLLTKDLLKKYAAIPSDTHISVLSDQPEIQCTILEITKKKTLFGANLEQYDSISNDAIKSKLTIANKPISLKPRLLEKTNNFEKIEISKDDQHLILKIHGKPISRNGSLELNGEKIAKITCH